MQLDLEIQAELGEAKAEERQVARVDRDTVEDDDTDAEEDGDGDMDEVVNIYADFIDKK